MTETLLQHTTIKLFGRVIADLGYTNVPAANLAGSGNNFLSQQLNANVGANTKPGFARIYAFSFQGHIYTLPKPAVFLVHGTGADLFQGGAGPRTSLDESGVIAREWEFAQAIQKDMKYWEYEKGDFSLRLDIDSGPLEQILLEAAMPGGTALTSGEQLRITSGEQLRVGGDTRKR